MRDAADRDLDADLAFGHHLLAVGAHVAADDVEALALSWFETVERHGPSALALTHEAVLTGPWRVSAEARRALKLPTESIRAFLLRCPVLRGGPPPERLIDPRGLTGAFREGMPLGVEAAALEFLLAAARRLAGSVRIAGSGVILTPDPDSDVNLCVYSPVWLDPDALVAALLPTLPTLRLAMDVADVEPPEAPEVPPDPAGAGAAALDAGERAWLHAEARAFDEAALAGPHVLEAYGAVADLGADGMLEVAVEGEDVAPLVLRSLDWAAHGAIAYYLRWWPADEDALYSPTTTPQFREARARARAQVGRAALALIGAVGGEITDEVGFLVEPNSLDSSSD